MPFNSFTEQFGCQHSLSLLIQGWHLVIIQWKDPLWNQNESLTCELLTPSTYFLNLFSNFYHIDDACGRGISKKINVGYKDMLFQWFTHCTAW